MEANELRQLGVAELKGRIKGWRDELFRSRFKGQTAEARDTSVYRKLKRDIARALTIMNQKTLAGEVDSTAPAALAEDKPKKVPQAASKATPKKESPEAPKKTAKAKTTKKKKAE